MLNQVSSKSLYSAVDFYRRVSEKLKNSMPGEYALVSVDIDNFSVINSLFGYKTGSSLLENLEKTFLDGLFEEEYCTRSDGDHFILFIKINSEVPLRERSLGIEDLQNCASKIFPDHYTCIFSGGIVEIDDPNEDVMSLIDKANFVRKRAKGFENSTFLYYDIVLDKELKWNNIITHSMKPALENGEFEMYLQPKVLLKTHQVIGAEALARWNSKEYGLIYPDKFIPVLEQNGFITKLDFYILEQACKFIQESINNRETPLSISVNFSKVHIGKKSFAEKIYNVVKNYGVDPKFIEIEMTESMISNDFDSIIKISTDLKSYGFKVSLDDFGSAYSSLNYLKNLPFDIIKIDKEFLNASSSSVKGCIIIAKMVELIKSIQMIPVVEGIETEEQENFLEKLNCDVGQGYLYSKPIPVNQFKEYLKNNLTLAYAEDMLLLAANNTVMDNQGQQTGIYRFQDITGELKKAEIVQFSLKEKIAELSAIIAKHKDDREALRLSEERYRLIVEQSEDIIYEWNFITDTIIFSERYEKVFKVQPIQNNITTNSKIRQFIHPEDLDVFEKWVKNTYYKPGFNKTEYRIKISNGDYIWIKTSLTAICDNQGNPIKAVGVLSNVTQHKEEMNELMNKAHFDSLTQLYNKETLQDKIENALVRNPNKLAALFIVDIDDFKGVNDNLGHQFGDMVLQEVAAKTKSIFRERDVVGRLGGDELLIFMELTDKMDIVAIKAELLNTLLHMTFFGETTQYTISASIGIAFYPLQGQTFNDLYKMADIALYESKRKGKNCYTIYNNNISDTITKSKTPFDASERFLTKYFNGDITFNIFEMLYETKDLKTTIDMILEMLGKKFNVDRVYIFENTESGKFSNNTYEWCAADIIPEISNLKNVPIDMLEVFFKEYNEEGIMYCDDIKTLDSNVFGILNPQGIKSMLHCALCKNGHMVGFIGFDDCKQNRSWRGDEIAILGYVSRILSVFMQQNQTMIQLAQINEIYS